MSPRCRSIAKMVSGPNTNAHAGNFRTLGSTGIFRRRLPVAAKIALATAGTMADVPASPMPPGASKLSRIKTSLSAPLPGEDRIENPA